jgi:hypothetical protein
MPQPDRWTSERFELKTTEFVEAVALQENDGPAPLDDPPKGRGPPTVRNIENELS